MKVHFSGSLGWWRVVCHLKIVCLLWSVIVFWSGFFLPLSFLRVDCECNRPSFLTTVFTSASAFNGNLNQWNVAKVTTMLDSKSIMAWRDVNSCYCEGSVGGWGCWWLCGVKNDFMACVEVVWFVFEDDVAFPEHAHVIGGVMYVVRRMFVYFGLSQYLISVLPPSILAYWLWLQLVRKCSCLLPPSTETSISGTSRKLPLWKEVSQYV
jgi:hypothetical protein